ncbi:hypothetical protein ACFQFC_27855 [Amorphoplanes digitatis]|uniref:Uncharacterized protein n=1 Tax=Actinoplanes digitatis TaxID=1868 RepID=A0A7W7HSE4_9ACTN|nr:hypothetical protein [Actinoplanes digitatis]MBB4759960.1 hypothetical protein [Actinoplanes digitatis]BFE67964.1 hypothetical protein GCM10020092_012650 [Actinoplanes digitatis]GID96508.1 hypothetical protein Adi01nite_59200 [Actinoplanes digitatis]
MIRDLPAARDVLTGRDGAALRDGGGDASEGVQATPERTIEVDLDDEPTADLRGSGRRRGWLRRLDARTRSILTGAAAAAVIVNAGAVWAYWRITDSETGRAAGGTVVEMNLRARSDLNKALEPGGTGNLTVTVTNDNDFPIRITSVSPGQGNIIADDEHREAGCANTGVIVAQNSVKVRWEVPRNTVGAFTVPDGLAMNADSDKACAGAVFVVPVLVSGMVGH